MADKKNETPVVDRATRIAELEKHKDSADELLNLQIEEYTEKRDTLEIERAEVVQVATRIKQLASGGPGSIELPVVIKDDVENPKKSSKLTTTIDATLLRGAGGDNAKRLLNQLADLFIQAKHQSIQIFEAENSVIISEILRRRSK